MHAEANDELVVADKDLRNKQVEVNQLAFSCKTLETELNSAKDKHREARLEHNCSYK